MKANYRFLRVKAGKSYFAQLELNVLPDGNGVTFENASPEKPNVDAGEMNVHTAPTWVSAAQEAIRDAVDHARAQGLLPAGCHVRLVKLIGSFVDTRDDVVRCAAALAAWQGVGGTEPRPEAEFDGTTWRLLFPASVGSPGSGTSS